MDEETAAHQREYSSLMRKFWFAAAVGIPVMLVAYPELPWLYLPNLFVKNVSESLVWWLFVLSGIVTIPVMAYAGRQFFTGGWVGDDSNRRRHNSEFPQCLVRFLMDGCSPGFPMPESPFGPPPTLVGAMCRPENDGGWLVKRWRWTR